MNTESGNYKNIHYGDILIKFSTIVDSKIDFIPFINKTVNVSSKMNLLKDGDIVIADTAEDYSAGKAIEIIVGDDKVLSGLHTIPCRPRFSFSSGYLGYYLNSYPFRKQLLPLIQGIKVYSVSKYMFNSLFISYPSLEEQQKVSDFLLKIDQRINTQNNIIRKYESLIKSIIDSKIYSLSSDKVSLSTFAILRNGYAFKSDKYVENGNYKIITISNVTGEQFISDKTNNIENIPVDIQEHQILKRNDILVSLTGNVGRVSTVNLDNCLLNQRVGLIQVKNIDLQNYIYVALSSYNFEKEMINKGQGAAQLNVSKNDVENFKIPFPTEEKLKISKIVLSYLKKLSYEKQIFEKYKKEKEYFLKNLFI